jgi:uncharacterized protein Yka (UPF0111/DUF47 family)
MFSLQRLFGKHDRFFDLLEASAQESRASVQALTRFLRNTAEVKNLDEFVASRRKEKKIKDEIAEALCTTLITALEREDIEALSVALYKIPKTAEKIGERISLAPYLLQGFDLTRHVTMLEKATETVTTMIRALRQGVNIENVKGCNDQLQTIEGEADKLMLELLRTLYTGSYDANRVVFMKDILELLEKVFDRCRDAGNVITQIVLKNS